MGLSLLDDIFRKRKLSPPRGLQVTTPHNTEFHGFTTGSILRGTPVLSNIVSSGPMTLQAAIKNWLSRNSSLLDSTPSGPLITARFIAANPQFSGYEGAYLLGFGIRGRPIIGARGPMITDNSIYGVNGNVIDGKHQGAGAKKPENNWPYLNSKPGVWNTGSSQIGTVNSGPNPTGPKPGGPNDPLGPNG